MGAAGAAECGGAVVHARAAGSRSAPTERTRARRSRSSHTPKRSRSSPPWPGTLRMARASERLLGDVEPEVANLAVADDVVLALEAELAAGAQVGEGAVDGDQLVVPVDLGPDESPRDVGVHRARGVLGAGPGRDGPRPYLVLARREERDEAEQGEALPQPPVDGALGRAEVRQDRLLRLALQARDLGFDDGRHPAHSAVGTGGHLGEAVALRGAFALGDRGFLDVDQVQDRLLGEKREAPGDPRLVAGE